jgi:3-methyl-2-oxobutanoate hydroxymethyltransferase
MKTKLQPIDIINMKKNNEKICMLTVYDFSMAKCLDEASIDVLLVGDSLGNVFCGYENTIPVTMEQIIYHTKAVSAAKPKALVVADMPFLSYQVSTDLARNNAGRLIKEGGAQAIKMEIIPSTLPIVKSILEMGLPVMGHLGFTPQLLYSLGGYKIQGKSEQEFQTILTLAKQLEALGCFAIVLEMIPVSLAQTITKTLTIPTIGIGAGLSCDGQVLVTNDLLNMDNVKKPRFVKKYANLNRTIKRAVQSYIKEVKNGRFPSDEYSFE